MASHHHHHHCHPRTTTTTSCCCCCPSTCCAPPPADPLIQSVASHIPHPPPQPYLYSPYLNTPYEPPSFHHHHHHQTPYHPPPIHQQKQEQFKGHHYHHQQQHTQPIVSSLLRRITALESSLRHQSSANTTSSYSLRDAAARTIQTHFRAFMVRRSRTLRQLKDLASIKSTLNALKTSLSNNAHPDSQAFSRRAVGLLLKLDSIQGGGPMIRDGKRSISRDLVRFLEFIDGVSVKRNKVSSIALKNVRFGGTGKESRVLYRGQRIGTADFVDSAGDDRELMEQLSRRVEQIRGFSGVPEEEDEEGIELENPKISINGMVGASDNRYGGLVKKHGGADQAKLKKSVSFANNRNASRVFITTHEPNSSEDVNSIDGSGSIDDERDFGNNHCREVRENGGFSKGSEDDEVHTEDDESPQISDGERHTGRNLRAEDNYEISGHYKDDNENFVFSAPLPVKMESRADLMKKKKTMKIVN